MILLEGLFGLGVGALVCAAAILVIRDLLKRRVYPITETRPQLPTSYAPTTHYRREIQPGHDEAYAVLRRLDDGSINIRQVP